MVRRFLAGILLILSALLLLASLAGIGAIWFYNEPLTRKATGRLKEIDVELGRAGTALASSEKELQRALQIVDAAQEALEKLTQETAGAENLFESIQSTLDDRLLPELKQTRTRIDSARVALESLESVLKGISRFFPGIDLNAPDRILLDLIASAQSLDSEIAGMETLAVQASTFVRDTSYLLGGDLSETRDSLQNFITAIQDYRERIANWRLQTQRLIEAAPGWIDQASIALTIFLTWFGLSQFGLFLHGLNILRGHNPFSALRREPEA